MSTQNVPPIALKSPTRPTPPPPPGQSDKGNVTGASFPKPSKARSWSDRADSAVRSMLELGERLRSMHHARCLYEMAEVVAVARQPEQVESALVRLAAEMGGGSRVELWLDRDERSKSEPKLIALWTETGEPMTDEQIEAMGYPLTLGLWCGEHYQMTLHLYASTFQAKKRWTFGMSRRLGALCAIAAAAERGLHVSQRGRIETPTNAKAPVRDATFLNAMLPYALAQAHRHREPLTLICAEIDKLGAIYRSHGPETAGSVVKQVAEAIARAVRGSDVVARLDDDRLIVVMPDAGGPAALNVAEKVRAAIMGAARPTLIRSPITASVGVACYPLDANEILSLLQAADDAMALAKARGGDQIAAISLPTPSLSLHQPPKIEPGRWSQRVG